ncbi:MAG TPA: hypothetical protein VNN77_07910 [candidate division Zixibacteria bacterium]|nr:hypothetical protein [candidate division Zixibacteria bacterium]
MAVHDLLRYDPEFLEEAVFHCLRGTAEGRLFRTERDRLYEIADAETRELAFRDQSARWFERRRLGAPLEQAVAEQPLLASGVARCVVALARSAKDEGAELFVVAGRGESDREKRSVAILLRPQSLLEPERVLAFLRHELFHIVDMLDPSFGYEPALPPAEGGPAHDSLLKARYRALWDATINGRMVRRGWLPPAVRAEELESFRRAFPFLGNETEKLFARFFDREPHTHGELAAFARAPGRPHAGRCPLCRFPAVSFEPAPDRLPAAVAAAIRGDFPSWEPAQGLCVQCADLYRAREISLFGARRLPAAAPAGEERTAEDCRAGGS